MGMKKAGAIAEQPIKQEQPLTQPDGTKNNTDIDTKVESGATAAIERLSKPKAEAKPAYKAYDADANALGKTRCVMFNAAVMSPAIAGMRFDTMEQYLALVKQAADAGVAYSFQK